MLTGSGVKRFVQEISASGIKFVTARQQQQVPQAQTMIDIVLEDDPSLIFNLEQISALEPWYLRKSQAELIKDEKLINREEL
jgi:hypothetical protein